MAERRNIMLGTAGHVDHGKTALVKLLTGCDTDRLPEEQRRGMTIELGFAPCRMADERIVGIVDVPGHVDFIRNMVAGAHGVDVVILVVAADDSVMPQTREHMDILTLMGCRRGLVALTKIDLIDEELRRMAIDDVRRFTQGTFLENAPICPLSNITGEGFEDFFEALNAAVAACPERQSGGLFRLWVERSFHIHGFGTVASGIPLSGQVSVGDRLRLDGGRLTARVRRMEVYGQPASTARAGECVALNLVDVEPDAIGRSTVLCEDDCCTVVEMFEADLALLPALPHPLKDHTECHLHIGAAEAMGKVVPLEGSPLAPGARHLVQVRLDRPLCVAPGERFVIRVGMAGLAGGRVTTLGGGRVLSARNLKLRRNRPEVLASLLARRDAVDDEPAWCQAVLKEQAAAVSVADLSRAACMKAARVSDILGGLRAQGVAVAMPGGAVVHRDAVEGICRRITAAMEQFHQSSPWRVGMEEQELLTGLNAEGQQNDAGRPPDAHGLVARELMDLALDMLLQCSSIERRGGVIALAGRGARLSAEDEQLCRRIEQTLAAAGVATPTQPELAAALGVDDKRLAAVLDLLIDRGTVVRLDDKVLMHREAVDAAIRVCLELFQRQGSFETAEFRDALGVSRKYAVPLLDYFDMLRLTARSGSRRRPGAEARRRACDPQPPTK